jgi:hypothetical protein
MDNDHSKGCDVMCTIHNGLIDLAHTNILKPSHRMVKEGKEGRNYFATL